MLAGRAARLLRVTAGRLVPVKKNARLLERPERLWDALFDAVPDIGGAVLVSGWLDSVFAHEYGDGLRVLLHRLYEAAGPVGFEEVATAVWQVASAPYVLDELTAEQLHGQRLSCDRDVRRVVDALASLKAVQGGEGGWELTTVGRKAVARQRGEPLPGDPVLQLRIELAEVEEPAVWRRVLVPAAARLDQLHALIQAAMGWQNCHMHEFTVDGVQYGRPHSELGFRDERAVVVGAVAKESGSFMYTYDFGDSWEHRVTVERVLHAEADRSYPVCTEGAGACPPEDCGGSWGYEEFKQALADPAHEEHDSMVEWLGLDTAAAFDAAHFAPGEANERIQRIQPRG